MRRLSGLDTACLTRVDECWARIGRTASERVPRQRGARYGGPVTDESQPALRLSDAERERGIAVLRDAAVEGRLTLEEFSERVGRAQVARTEPDLADLLADLPARTVPAAPATAAAPERPVARFAAVFSRMDRTGRWELPERSSLRCVCGTVNLDLRQATLHGEVVELEVFNLFGTVTLIVPEGVPVSVEGGGMFASQVIEQPSSEPVAGAPRLRVRARGPGGTLYLRARPQLERGRQLLEG